MSAQGPQTLEPATGTQSLSELIVSFANIFFIFYEFFKNTFNFDLSLMLRKQDQNLLGPIDIMILRSLIFKPTDTHKFIEN